MKSTRSNDRPLSGSENFALLAAAAVTIALLYLFLFGSALVLLTVVAVDLVLVIALARVGLSRFYMRTIRRHTALLSVSFRSLWIGKSASFQLPIRRGESPALDTMLEKVCTAAGVPLPRKVVLEMGVNAWVNLKGVRRGAGTTTLGIGYDLLAGLTSLEMEGVLAHEMMHAKLVQRGFRQLLVGGITRAGKLTGGIAAEVATTRAAKKSDVIGETLLAVAHRLTWLAARQVARCSRQDEFEADRGAAMLCGPAAIRSSLLKLEGLTRIASRLQLGERIARLESGQGFSHWLVAELAAATASDPAEMKAEAFNEYSTHPNLRDRLAALPVDSGETLPDSAPAIHLLADPDNVAASLVAAIQKQLIANERKDSKQLDRWSRKSRTPRHTTPLQLAGWVILLATFIPLLSLTEGGGIEAVVIACSLCVTVGVALILAGKYRETLPLPTPSYTKIKQTAAAKAAVTKERVQEIEAALKETTAGMRNSKKIAAAHLSQSYEALAGCDYVTAHIAARFVLAQQKKSVEGHLALAVAAGGLNQQDQARRAIAFVQHRAGMKTPSPAWGAGWASLLIKDWARAEAYLEQALVKKPGNDTLLALLAISQSRRAKLFSAIDSARKARALQPGEPEYTKLLIDLLLQGGFLREASEVLREVEGQASADTELMHAMVKLHLLQRNEAEAGRWTELVGQNSEGPEKYVTLGQTCEAARANEQAEEHYLHALRVAHYPEALLGLGRLEAARGNKEQAERYLLGGLDFTRPAGEGSVGTIPMVIPILQQLMLLRDPVSGCQAWIAKLPANATPAAIAGKSFVVFGRDKADVHASLDAMTEAMQPGSTPIAATWRLAPGDQQPRGVVHPGIQAVLD